jgi:hypothetical protein
MKVVAMKTLVELTERAILGLAFAQDYFSRDFQSAGVRFWHEADKSDMPREYWTRSIKVL